VEDDALRVNDASDSRIERVPSATNNGEVVEGDTCDQTKRNSDSETSTIDTGIENLADKPDRMISKDVPASSQERSCVKAGVFSFSPSESMFLSLLNSSSPMTVKDICEMVRVPGNPHYDGIPELPAKLRAIAHEIEAT
jgi:hypothetical protein